MQRPCEAFPASASLGGGYLPMLLQDRVRKGMELSPSVRGLSPSSCPAPHCGSGHGCGASGRDGFASWHLCKGDSGWSHSRGCCQAGAWQKSENFLTVTNACLRKCVFIYQWCVQLGCVLEKLSRPPRFEPPLLRKRLKNVLLYKGLGTLYFWCPSLQL